MITREADYAIRTVLYLAKRFRKGPISTTEIGEEMTIPYRFLRRITRKLVEKGVLEAQRGKLGGVSLVIEPRKISLFDVMEIFDQRGITINVCCSPKHGCRREALCPVHPHFESVQQDFHRSLKKVNFARLAKESF